ncbi:hypothetical protein L1987_13422 [Smallanthus sonchifolius]|uniref:Uncharacterized protein n=1 Tax=Smallanthus sonchifolius TaxID=185202 RepID=A0ACB9JIM0_9ASTR|nr:hypothetical protein L1987_13422 [Smallanthus sonchifolius]
MKALTTEYSYLLGLLCAFRSVRINGQGNTWFSTKYGRQLKVLGPESELWILNFQELKTQVCGMAGQVNGKFWTVVTAPIHHLVWSLDFFASGSHKHYNVDGNPVTVTVFEHGFSPLLSPAVARLIWKPPLSHGIPKVVFDYLLSTTSSNIKSNTLLLFSNYNPNAIDCDHSRLGNESHNSIAAQGSLAYVDLQSQRNFHLFSKRNVISFGMVNVDIVTTVISAMVNRLTLLARLHDQIGSSLQVTVLLWSTSSAAAHVIVALPSLGIVLEKRGFYGKARQLQSFNQVR